jgi:hypothetical protein
MYSPEFKDKMERTRKELLNELAKTYIANNKKSLRKTFFKDQPSVQRSQSQDYSSKTSSEDSSGKISKTIDYVVQIVLENLLPFINCATYQ